MGGSELSNDEGEETAELVTVTFVVIVAFLSLVDVLSAVKVEVLVPTAVSKVSVVVAADERLEGERVPVTDPELVASVSAEDKCSRSVELDEVKAPVTPNAELFTQGLGSVDDDTDSDSVPADLVAVET
ncbi:uncharacterized protein MAM_03305 [Metarhizium album ARSEF 1941]|uniref:Uncharacterized protein n=1 Tax=Metarhizium album (strain ARSEF 1941) TaxID=1081103 RepID=A0A0B2WXT6_METAS|nr:uncharacterized protein MAM_03305 [Metarhizium album ARSEF 1941]KHN98843.1 hypothetical protein MAM_03305 [Metarhizium album ARSEF 1941]